MKRGKWGLTLVLLFVMPLCAMDIAEKTKFKLYSQEGPEEIVYISPEALQLSSTLLNMVEDFGGDNSIAIPVNASNKALERLVRILEVYVAKSSQGLDPLLYLRKIAQSYSSQELVELINCADFLGVKDDILQLFGDIITNQIRKQRIKEADYEIFKQCNIDFVNKFIFSQLVPQMADYAKLTILKKGDEERKFFIENVPTGVTTFGYSGVFLNDDQWIAIGSMNDIEHRGQVIIYNAADRDIPIECDVCPTNLTAYKNKYVVVWEEMDTQFGVRIYNIADLKNIKMYDYQHPQGSFAYTSAFSPDGKYLALTYNGANNNIVMLDMAAIDWDAQRPVMDTNKVHFFTDQGGHKEDKIFFIPNTNSFVIASAPVGNLRLVRVDYESKVITSQFIPQPTGSMIKKMNFSNDGKYIVSANLVLPKSNITINIFDAATGEFVKDFDGPSIRGEVVTVLFSPDNQWVLCASVNELFIYDVAQGKLLAPVNGLRIQSGVSFSADGNKLLLAGSDPGFPYGYSGLLWTILTHQEHILLQQLYTYSIDQVMLIYRLCADLYARGFALIDVDSVEMKIFNSLHKDMQNFLLNIGVNAGKTWGEWIVETIPKYLQVSQ